MSDTRTIRLLKPHPAQLQVMREAERYNVLTCGRRWGKTRMGGELAIKTALAGQPAGWFTETYKLLDGAWDEILETLNPLGDLIDSNKTERIIKIRGLGSIEFWTLKNNPNPGRSRKYKLVVVDESAHAPNLESQ